MPKFLTYQRPPAVNKQHWGGRPGVAYGKAGKHAPKTPPVPAQRPPAIDVKLVDINLPGGLPKR
jgi:hypothetical protein